MTNKDINQTEDERFNDGYCLRPWPGDDGTQKNCIENGHCGCVAFIEKGETIPVPRCSITNDMFGY
jgi:hypothetical protein